MKSDVARETVGTLHLLGTEKSKLCIRRAPGAMREMAAINMAMDAIVASRKEYRKAGRADIPNGLPLQLIAASIDDTE